MRHEKLERSFLALNRLGAAIVASRKAGIAPMPGRIPSRSERQRLSVVPGERALVAAKAPG